MAHDLAPSTGAGTLTSLVGRTSSPIEERQPLLFPRKAVRVDPKQEGSADAFGEITADDTLRYKAKLDQNGRPVRASEWVSTHIAEAIGICVPTPAQIRIDDGSLIFGSRRLGGVAEELETQALLQSSTPPLAGLGMVGLGSQLSRIYALDLSLNNDDRHIGNYLIVREGGLARLYAIDFSRSLLWNWPINGLMPLCNTRIHGPRLLQIHGFDLDAAFDTLQRLDVLATETVAYAIATMPPEWLPDATREHLLTWWQSADRKDHNEAIRRGLRDGSLL